MAPLKPASVNKRGNALATKTPASKTKISAVHDEFDFENELPQAERTPRPQSPSGDGRDDIQSLLGLISERLSTRMDSRKRKLNEMTDNIMSNANGAVHASICSESAVLTSVVSVLTEQSSWATI